MMDKIKNIVVINDFDFIQGGASKVAIYTANELSRTYKDVDVFYFSGNHNDKSNLDERIRKICLNQNEALRDKNKIRGIINGIYNIKAKRELEKLLKQLDKNNTIIHIHGWTKVLSSSIFDIIYKMDFKAILTLHDYFTACPNGGYYNYKKNIICEYKPLSFKCIKCNCDSRNYFFKIYRIIRQTVQNKIVKINKKILNVITISDLSEGILKKTLNGNVKIYRIYNPIEDISKSKVKDYKKNNYFLYVGRIEKEKGVDVFCKAITETNQHGIVVGDGSQLQVLKEKFKNIKFEGWKNSNEVEKYMLNAKALIFPSKWHETMGMTVVEAQNVGLPVIVNNKTAAAEFVIDNKFKYNDFDELIKIINNFDKYEYIFNSYIDNYIDRLYITYKTIIKEK